MKEEFDYVVVGSGAAGATAARILCDVTGSVALVEEGPAVAAPDFSDRAFPSLARLYRQMGAQVTSGRAPMLVIQGRCLGGSTVVNSAIMRRLPEEVWTDWSDRHGLAAALPLAEIEAAEDAVESELGVEATPPEVWGANNRLLSSAGAAAGIGGAATRRNVRGCRGTARCNLGCPVGAKQSMEVTYIPRAVSRGASVLAGERAERIVLRGGRAVEVRTAGRALAARRAVLVAASAVETPRLLRRSGVRSAHLGRHFQAHPGMAVVGLFDQEVRLDRGATQGYELYGLREESRIKVETLAVTPETYFGGLPGVGRSWASLMAEYSRAAVWVLPLRSQAEGEVGDRAIHYGLDRRDFPYLRRGLRRAAELMFLAGAREVVCPVHGLPGRLRPGEEELIERLPDDPSAYPLAISHLFGTARLSARPEDGVVGTGFRVHGTENLYVVDSSVFPTNLGVNPQLSIMALARIAAERIAG